MAHICFVEPTYWYTAVPIYCMYCIYPSATGMVFVERTDHFKDNVNGGVFTEDIFNSAHAPLILYFCLHLYQRVPGYMWLKHVYIFSCFWKKIIIFFSYCYYYYYFFCCSFWHLGSHVALCAPNLHHTLKRPCKISSILFYFLYRWLSALFGQLLTIVHCT